MKKKFLNGTKMAIIIIAACVISFSSQAQEKNAAYEKAKAEIIQTFGIFPTFFDAFPQYALHGAWQSFKEIQSPGNIDSKNRELIQLAVAAQIPCPYCVFFHKESARAHGATDEEIKEAVALGANTRHWSMVIQGSEMDMEQFKKEFKHSTAG